MDIRTEVREVENYIKSMSPSPAAQIAIISKAQSLTLDNKHALNVLSIVKMRIIHAP